MDEPKVIEFAVAADWWVLAGALQALLYLDRRRNSNAPGYSSAPIDGYRFTIGGQATVQFTTGPAPTTVRIEYPRAPGADDYFKGIHRYLAVLGDFTTAIRREVQLSADEVIELYYRKKAQKARVTLRQLAEQYGYNLSYLSTVKAAYDKRGGYGAKTKTKPKQKSIE